LAAMVVTVSAKRKPSQAPGAPVRRHIVEKLVVIRCALKQYFRHPNGLLRPVESLTMI